MSEKVPPVTRSRRSDTAWDTAQKLAVARHVSWPVALPDLRSRLKAATVVEIGEPDDELLAQVLVKLFADRQLAVDESLVSFLTTRTERSFAAARATVEKLDREALRLKRPVTRALAGELFREP